MENITLQQIVQKQPFHDYREWWDMGQEFISFMADAIVSQWLALPGKDEAANAVKTYVLEYIHMVYGRDSRSGLVDAFVNQDFSQGFRSGEFDALSYGFFRSAFERIEVCKDELLYPVSKERRRFTQRVGKAFFKSLKEHLGLNLPAGLKDQTDFAELKIAIQQIGGFLKEQGYLRDHFDFFIRAIRER